MPAWLLWIVAGGLLATAEVLSLDLVLIMLAGGTLVAGGAAALGAPFGLQIVVFAVSALGLLFVVRPVAKRHLEESTTPISTGIEALVGSEAHVVRTVDAQGGLVRLSGEEWSARSYDSTQVLEIGQAVRVIEIKGATALVWGEP